MLSAFHHLATCLCLISLILLPSFAQQSLQRDPQALAVATQAYKALGGSLPTDSRSQGTYDRTVGSSEDYGTVEILTRNFDQTSEKYSNSAGTEQTVYSRGYASQWSATAVTRLGLEKSLATSSIFFPIVVIAPAIQHQDSTVQFVGTETVNGVFTNHIQICASSPDQNFTDIASFATKDIWVASDSGLPVQISVQVFDVQGAAPVPLTATFSNYQSESGVLYPFKIQISLNGTPYNTITISTVAFGVGLSDQDFPLH